MISSPTPSSNNHKRLALTVICLMLFPALVFLGLNLWNSPHVSEDIKIFWRAGLDFSWRMFGFLAAAFGVHFLARNYSQSAWFAKLKINAKVNSQEQEDREIASTIKSCYVFAFLSIFVSLIIASDYSGVYFEVEKHGWTWFVLSIPAMAVMHDVYFFLTHRLLHTKWLYRRIHIHHHRSRYTSVWSTLSAHPIEAAINFGIIFIFVFMPIHFSALAIWTVLMAVINVLGHGGYETSFATADKHFFYKYIGSASNHDAHHKFNNVNYGFYFTIWDKMAGTHLPVLTGKKITSADTGMLASGYNREEPQPQTGSKTA